MRMRVLSLVLFPVSGFLLTLCSLGTTAEPPALHLPTARLFTIYPPGGQQGTTVEVSLSGLDLDEVQELVFSEPGITAHQKMAGPGPADEGSQPIRNQFAVTIAPTVLPGVCEVRAVGKYGISNSRAFTVSTLSETLETEPNNTLPEAAEANLESIVNGTLGEASDVDCFKFSAKAGQRVLIDCLAARIDSRLEAVLSLHDAKGRELATSRYVARSDPLLDLAVPADGVYWIKLRDSVYRASEKHFYRLSISTQPHVDFIFPPMGVAGKKSPFVLYGRNLPGGQEATGVAIAGKTLQRLPVEIELPGGPAAEELAAGTSVGPSGAVLDGTTYRLPAAVGVSQPLFVALVTAPVVTEVEPNNGPKEAQKVEAPCEYAGQFYPQHDHDWVDFDVKKGDVFWIEVFSHRLGRVTDPLLHIQYVKKSDTGEAPAIEIGVRDDIRRPHVAFDTSSEDAAYRFSSPGDGACRIHIFDQVAAPADPRGVYRLSIRREKPDFRLVALPRSPAANPADAKQNLPNIWSPLLRPGGTEIIDIVAIRRDGFKEEIRVTVEGLPAGVTSPEAILAQGQTATTVVLEAEESAAPWVGSVRLVGKAKIGETEVTRRARAAAMVWPAEENRPNHSRFTHDLALAVAASRKAPFLVRAGSSSVLEMSRAGTLDIPIEVIRRGEFEGEVLLRAVSPPLGMKPKELKLEGSSGTYTLSIPPKAPLETFTFHLNTTAEVSYSRNPEAAREAAEKKEELDKIAAQLMEEVKQAEEAKTLASSAVDAAAEALKKATDAVQAREEGEVTAAQVKAAAEDVKEVADALKAAADRTAASAQARAEVATTAQAAAEKLATETAEAAKPKNVKVGSPSTAITLRITAAPIKISVAAPPAALQPGGKVELPVTITRLYGYVDPIEITVKVPGGLKAQGLTVPKDQSVTTVVLEAEASATPGKHNVTIEATAKLNGQDLKVSQVVVASVIKE